MNIFDSDRGPIWPRLESVNRFWADDPECGADFQFLTVFGADFWLRVIGIPLFGADSNSESTPTGRVPIRAVYSVPIRTPNRIPDSVSESGGASGADSVPNRHRADRYPSCSVQIRNRDSPTAQVPICSVLLGTDSHPNRYRVHRSNRYPTGRVPIRCPNRVWGTRYPPCRCRIGIRIGTEQGDTDDSEWKIGAENS